MLSTNTKQKINEWLDTFTHGEQIVFDESKSAIQYFDECGCLIDEIKL